MSTLLRKANPVQLIQMYGITEKKKAELDALTLEVLDAQHDVQQFQAIVASLNEKFQKFQGFLDEASANANSTLINKNLVEQLVQSVIDLRKNSNITFTEMGLADASTQNLSVQVNSLIGKLIFAAEIINKLANVIIRNKAVNPLISDEMVSRVTAAGSDANAAVALTLIALRSTSAATATNMESQSATSLEYHQSLTFYKMLTGNTQLLEPVNNANKIEGSDGSLLKLLSTAHKNAKAHYEQMLKACEIITRQLNNAQSSLNQANMKLRSLQSGLSAGTAAALAS